MDGRARSGTARAAAVLLVTGAACGPADPPPGDTLRLAVRADVTGVFPNPPISAEGYTLDVANNLFGTLVRLGGSLQVEPALAERWENPDEHTYVFHLRPGLRFADGRPLLARDVAASLSAVAQHGWPTRDTLQAIDSVQADGERRVVVRTRVPYPALLPRLHRGYVLPADAVEAQPVPIVASGPYRLVRWEPGHLLSLEANPYYWDRAPDFARVRYEVVPDAEDRVGLVLEGRADLADQVPSSRAEGLRGRPGIRVISRPGLRVLFLTLRADRHPFDDARVREAIDLALDREELIRRVLDGAATPASQIVSSAVFGYDPDILATRPDPDRARELLQRAGHAGGLQVRLDGPRDRYVADQALLNEVARQLAAVGISVEVQALPKSEFFPLIDSGGSAFHLLGWACNSGDSSEVLESLLHTPGEGWLGGYNSTGLRDPELDRLLESSNERRGRQRGDLLREAMRRVADSRVVLPLLVQTETLLVSTRVAWDPPADLALRPAEMRRAEPAPR